tara:strand:+ start:540 stop:1076 length:537 start_codon:yes stop_codon:yes gene_type:complete
MSEILYPYVLQSNVLNDPSIKNIQKILKSVVKPIKKFTHRDPLNIYVFINQKKIMNIDNANKLSKEDEDSLVKFCKEYEGSVFLLFFHTSKMLWHANFRNLSAKFDFTAYGTYPKLKPGVWMSYSGGEYDSGIAHDPSTGDTGSFDEYNLTNKEAKKRNITWIKNYLSIKESDLKKFS